MAATARPLLLGHRGARATSAIPENTLASFDRCMKHGCDGFEFDVRGTADGTLVVCHDGSFRGLRLSSALGSDLAPRQAEGFLPTLEAVLQRFGPHSVLDIELKDAGLEAQILQVLRRYPPQRRYVITSFLPEVLLRLRELEPTIELGFLWDAPSTLWRALPVQWVLPERTLLDDNLASALRAAGKRIGTWTVNGPADMLHFSALGAEMLISDDTSRLVNTFPVS